MMIWSSAPSNRRAAPGVPKRSAVAAGSPIAVPWLAKLLSSSASPSSGS